MARTARRRVLTALAVAAVAVGFQLVLVSPGVYQWGSTETERAQPMAGDDIVDAPAFVSTRSITIDAPADTIWPWLVQMGQDKGGFYTFDWAERLAGDPIRNADAVHLEWQDLDVGDFVHPFPPERGLPSWRVRELVPGRLLVVALDDDTWSWGTELRDLGVGRTRVVTRMRGQRTALSAVLDPADLVVFPRVLVGLEQRAEGTLPGMPNTFTGSPLPTARLPVHWWAALAWVAGLAGLGVAGGRVLALGHWRQPRPHPGVTIAVAFVAGAGYMIMSDTPPDRFLTIRPMGGLALAAAVTVVVRGVWSPHVVADPGWLRRGGRAAVAVAEIGVLVVLPVTAVWQAATAQGWTERLWTRTVVGAVAVAAALVVSSAAMRGGGPARQSLLPALLFGAGFVVTGAGLIPAAGAALLEMSPLSGALSTWRRDPDEDSDRSRTHEPDRARLAPAPPQR